MIRSLNSDLSWSGRGGEESVKQCDYFYQVTVISINLVINNQRSKNTLVVFPFSCFERHTVGFLRAFFINLNRDFCVLAEGGEGSEDWGRRENKVIIQIFMSYS